MSESISIESSTSVGISVLISSIDSEAIFNSNICASKLAKEYPYGISISPLNIYFCKSEVLLEHNGKFSFFFT